MLRKDAVAPLSFTFSHYLFTWLQKLSVLISAGSGKETVFGNCGWELPGR